MPKLFLAELSFFLDTIAEFKPAKIKKNRGLNLILKALPERVFYNLNRPEQRQENSLLS